MKWKWMYMYNCRWMWKIIPLWTPLFVDIGGIQVLHGKHLIYNWRSTLLKLTGIRKEFSIHLYLFHFIIFFKFHDCVYRMMWVYLKWNSIWDKSISHMLDFTKSTMFFSHIKYQSISWKKKGKYQRKNNNILIFFKSQFIWDI